MSKTCENVVALLAHLLVDRIDRLFPARHHGVDAGLREAVADHVEQAVHHLAPVAARRLDRVRENAKAHRVEVLEREILQLEVQRVQPSRLAIGA
jgi:hypothetical protein